MMLAFSFAFPLLSAPVLAVSYNILHMKNSTLIFALSVQHKNQKKIFKKSFACFRSFCLHVLRPTQQPSRGGLELLFEMLL